MGRPPTISRPQLLATARGVFSRKGFAATTLADIAAELGVTPAAILRYTKSKESLFAEAMTQHLHEMPSFLTLLDEEGAELRPRATLAKFAHEFVDFLQHRIGDVMVVAMHLNASLPDIVRASIGDKPKTAPVLAVRALQSYFRRCAKAGTMRDLPSRPAALAFLGAFQIYVVFHQVLHLSSAPPPLKPYIDSVLDIWAGGALLAPRTTTHGGTRGKTPRR